MAFDLEVSMTGLCVFVPDAKNPQMHVLMVEPMGQHGGGGGHGGGTGTDRHYPRIYYDAAHDDSTVARGKFWRVVPLDRAILDLSSYGSSGTKGGTLSDIPILVDITQDVQRLPDPTKTPQKGLVCRLTLPLATKIDSPKAKGGWELRRSPQTRKMPKAAWIVVWTIANVGKTDLALAPKPFTGETRPTLPLRPLRPIKDGNRKVVRLLVSNVVSKESGPPQGAVVPSPAKAGRMPHFEAYGEFYSSAGSVPIPWPELHYTGVTAKRGTPYSCLPSGGK